MMYDNIMTCTRNDVLLIKLLDTTIGLKYPFVILQDLMKWDIFAYYN